MIRKRERLIEELQCGATIARMLGFGSLNEWRWCLTDTNEPVPGATLKWALKNEKLKVIQTDIAGEPMQYAAA